MVPTVADELGEIAKRLRQEHRALANMLAELRTDAERLRLGTVPKHRVEDRVYELWAKLEELALIEERLLLPLASRLGTDDAGRVHSLLREHDVERRLLLSTLDLTESGLLSGDELVAVSTRLVRTLRADIALEEELLADLHDESGQTSASAR